MKKLFDICSDFHFYTALAFLFSINLSIAGSYLFFTPLALLLIIYTIKNKKWPEVPKYYKYFLLYILFSFISSLFSIDKADSLKDNREFFVFLLIPIIILIINSKKRLEYSLFIVLISAIINALYGIYQVVALPEGASLIDHRPKGFTSHWMTFAGLLMFAFIFFLVYIFYEKRTKIKMVIAASLLLILAAILISLTRSVWVGMFIAVGSFIIYYKPKILYAAVPAALILVFILPQSVKNRVVSIFDTQNETNRDRIYMIKTGIKIFKEYPLTGVGATNVGKVYDKYKPKEAALSNPHLHNNFLHELAERGIFALLSLLAAFISIFILLVRKIKTGTGPAKTVAAGVLFAFIGFLTAGMFEYNFGDTEIKFMLLYFLSIPFIRFEKEKEKYLNGEHNDEIKTD
jgi:O-antigen ligase